MLGCIPPANACIVDLVGVIPVNILAYNTLQVRGQCWRVIANQRVAACTILTAVVSVRFILYEEQIGAVPYRGVEFNEDHPSDFTKCEQMNKPHVG